MVDVFVITLTSYWTDNDWLQDSEYSLCGNIFLLWIGPQNSSYSLQGLNKKKLRWLIWSGNPASSVMSFKPKKHLCGVVVEFFWSNLFWYASPLPLIFTCRSLSLLVKQEGMLDLTCDQVIGNEMCKTDCIVWWNVKITEVNVT